MMMKIWQNMQALKHVSLSRASGCALVILLGILPVTSATGQPNELAKYLFQGEGNPTWEPANTPTAWLPTLDSAFQDSLVAVQFRALRTIEHLATHSGAQAWQAEIADLLVKHLEGNPELGTEIVQVMKLLPPEAFTAATRQQLIPLINKPSAAFSPLVRLGGALGLSELNPLLINKLLADPPMPPVDRWSAWIVLARLGNPQAMEFLLRSLSQKPTDDETVEVIYPDLVYTQQRALLEVIVRAVQSSDAGCTSMNNDRPEAVPCAYRAMEYLPLFIQGFPFSLNETGDLDVADYPTALEEIRAWLADHPRYTLKAME